VNQLSDIRPLSTYTHAPLRLQPGLVMGYGRLPLPSVPGATAALARTIRRAMPDQSPIGHAN
jgi:hypothetical protein